MELAMLRGARTTLEKFRPILYMEIGGQENSKPLVQFLRELGYKLYWHQSPLFNPDNYFENQTNVFGPAVSLNLLCIHGSVKASINGLKEVLE